MLGAVFRDHYYTTSVAEVQFAGQHGFAADGTIPGRVFLNPVPGTIPLYRCFFPAPALDHFYTANKAEFNKAESNGCSPLDPADGIIGHLYQKRICGSIPLYRMYNEVVHDHFYTSNKEERDIAINTLGYKGEGVVGYVLPY